MKVAQTVVGEKALTAGVLAASAATNSDLVLAFGPVRKLSAADRTLDAEFPNACKGTDTALCTNC